jgi:hypothetical protein
MVVISGAFTGTVNGNRKIVGFGAGFVVGIGESVTCSTVSPAGCGPAKGLGKVV